MPDKITTKPNRESAPIGDLSNQPARSCQTQLIALCAACLGGSFFLPWASDIGGSISGFDLQKLGDNQRLLWFIPAFSIITIVAGVSKSGQKSAAQVAGLLPFAAGTYWYCKLGHDLFQLLAVGAYLSLIFGAALIVLPWIKFGRQP